jgi:transcriptional regulator with XRE-family HTH domain
MAKPSPSHARNPRIIELGVQIRKARLELGWSQEKLAAEAGLDRSYMGGIERGEHNLALINLFKISDALGLSASQLFAEAHL